MGIKQNRDGGGHFILGNAGGRVRETEGSDLSEGWVEWAGRYGGVCPTNRGSAVLQGRTSDKPGSRETRCAITGIQSVDRHHFAIPGCQLSGAERNVHAIDLGGIDEPTHVLLEPEDGRPLRGRMVAADAFEYRASVAGDVRKNVDLGLVLGCQAAIVPDPSVGLSYFNSTMADCSRPRWAAVVAG